MCNVISTLFNVVLTLFENPFENPTSGFASFSTSDQCYLNVDPQCWNNVDQTLKCWLGLLLKGTSRKLLFHVKNADFQPPDTVKNYFTGAFQAFYTRSRSSHATQEKSLKIQEWERYGYSHLVSMNWEFCGFLNSIEFYSKPIVWEYILFFT